MTDVGRVRSANEDSLGEALTPNGHLFVVCDGMGGHVGGAVASSKAVESLIEFFQKDTYDNPIQALDHALSFANEQIYAATMIQPELKGMGTTAVVVLVRNEECFIAHVGDSRIYLFSDGKLNRLTKDHSYVQTLVDANIIADEDAENHPNKNQILQALGIAPVVKSTVCSSPVLPKKGDVFLLCSDGLNGMVNDREMERLLNQNQVEEWQNILINAALEAGGKDNVTASLIEITESSNHTSTFVNFNPKSPEDLDKTREVSIDHVNRSMEDTKAIKKPINRMYLFAGIGFLLSGIAFLILFILNKSNESEKISSQTPLATSQLKDSILSADSLQKLMVLSGCDSTSILKLNKRKCNFINDTVSQSCQNYTCKAIVGKDSIISILIVPNSSGQNEVLPETKKLVNEHSLKTDSVKFNSLDKILKEFKKYCPQITGDEIVKYNIDQNKSLKEDQKEKLLKKELDIDWKILCPPCNTKKQ